MTLPTAERCRELAKGFDGTGYIEALAALRWAATVLEGMGREPVPSGELAMRISCGFDGACNIGKTQDAIAARDAAHQAELLALREALKAAALHLRAKIAKGEAGHAVALQSIDAALEGTQLAALGPATAALNAPQEEIRAALVRVGAHAEVAALDRNAPQEKPACPSCGAELHPRHCPIASPELWQSRLDAQGNAPQVQVSPAIEGRGTSTAMPATSIELNAPRECVAPARCDAYNAAKGNAPQGAADGEERCPFEEHDCLRLRSELHALRNAPQEVKPAEVESTLRAIVEDSELRERSGWSCVVCMKHLEDRDSMAEADRHWPHCPIPRLKGLLPASDRAAFREPAPAAGPATPPKGGATRVEIHCSHCGYANCSPRCPGYAAAHPPKETLGSETVTLRKPDHCARCGPPPTAEQPIYYGEPTHDHCPPKETL